MIDALLVVLEVIVTLGRLLFIAVVIALATGAAWLIFCLIWFSWADMIHTILDNRRNR